MSVPADRHCMHFGQSMEAMPARTPQPTDRRLCCWCGLEQHPVYASPAQHGPYLEIESRPAYWEPSSQGPCPARAKETIQ